MHRLALVILFCGSGSLDAAAKGYWHTRGNQIVDEASRPVSINGVNWYGFETTDRVPHGLTQRDYRDLLQQTQRLGFNVVRLPFANETIESAAIPEKIAYRNAEGPINQDLRRLTSLQVMDKIVASAGALNLQIILDNHRSDVGNGPQSSGLWYTKQYTEARWIADWQMLVRRYKGSRTAAGDPVLIGVDLRNEPHSVGVDGACWTGDPARGGCPAADRHKNWTAAAIRAGNAVLREEPNLLIFVQGTDCYAGDCSFWGSNLQGVRKNKVVLTVPDRVVYSPHDYGPNEYRHPWFNDAATPGSLVETWVRYWAYLVRDNVAPVWVGEFGTGASMDEVSSDVRGSQGQWFQTFITFLHDHKEISWSYWALNGEDRYGLLAPNYHFASSPRMQALTRLLAAPSDTRQSGTPGQ